MPTDAFFKRASSPIQIPIARRLQFAKQFLFPSASIIHLGIADAGKVGRQFDLAFDESANAVTA